jgi:DNA-binding transcriptional LysR family regulator
MSNLRFLRTFVAAAHGGSFAAAADQIALTQAAVGQQIRALEAELGKTLFDKTGRVMVLSPAGQRLLPRAEQLLAQYEELRRDLQERDQIAGSVKLGSLVSAMGLLSTTLARLKTRHPRLEVHLRLQDHESLLRDVLAGKLDAAMLVERPWPAHAGTQWTRCYEEKLAVIANSAIASASTPVASLFQNHPFLRFDRHTPTGTRIDRVMKQLGLVPRDLLELNSLLAIVELVRKNVGFTLAPLLRNFDWESDASLCVLHLPGRPLARRIGMLESGRRRHITAAIREELLAQLG